MSNSSLFQTFRLRNLELRNRIIIAPMCQYSAEEGCMTDWHAIHLGHLALSGAALLTIEATAVLPEGRISYADAGLWNGETQAAIGKVLSSTRRWSDIPIAIQLAHAGRKASTDLPWKGGKQFESTHRLGWQPVAPSAIAHAETEIPPTAMDREGLRRVLTAFAEAAARAASLGIDVVQIHAAHGYLLHQFLSPLSNQRSDEYGGSLENRMRFPLQIFDAVRAAFPNGPVSVRVSGSDWVPGGWDIEQTVAFALALQQRGCDGIHVSSGGLHPAQKIPTGPGYQVPLARAVKAAVRIPVVAVGQITDYGHAESIVSTGDADFVAIARAALYDPRWPWHAAAALGGQVQAPNQYLRCQPQGFPDLLSPITRKAT